MISELWRASFLNSIERKTGIPALEWVSAHMPVLSVEQGYDLSASLAVGVRTRIIDRANLAERLGLDTDRPFGEQLAMRKVISSDEARYLDKHLLEDGGTTIRLRFDAGFDQVGMLMKRLCRLGLIDSHITTKKTSGYLFVEVTTRYFTTMAKTIERQMPDAAVVVSVSDRIICEGNHAPETFPSGL